MANYKAKYYAWRRKRIRENARNRRKIATNKHSFLQMHMIPKERKKYEALGLKWYRASNFKFGTDITGLGLSKDDLAKITNLRGEGKKVPTPVLEHNPVVVTFEQYLDDDGEPVDVPVYNGVPNVHPKLGMQSDLWQGYIERNGKANN